MMQKISFVARMALAFVLIVYGFVWFCSPWLTRHFLSDILQEKELHLAEGSHLRYNPFVSRVVLDDFAIEDSKGVVFSIDEAELDLSLYRLLWSSVYVDTLYFDGLFLSVNMQGDELVIGGFSIPSGDNAEQDVDVEKDLAADSKLNDFLASLSISLPKLHIKKSEIVLHTAKDTYPLVLNNVLIQDVALSQADQQADVALKAKLLGGQIDINADFNFGGSERLLRSEIKIKEINLARIESELPTTVKALAGKLSITTAPEMHWQGEDLNISAPETVVLLKDTHLQSNGVDLRVDAGEVSLGPIQAGLNNGVLMNLEGAGSTSMQALAISSSDNRADYVSFETLKIPTINFSAQEDIAQSVKVAVQGLIVESLLLSKVAVEKSADDALTKDEAAENNATAASDETSETPATETAAIKNATKALPPLLKAKQLSLDSAEYTASAITLGTLVLADIESHIIMATDGGLATLVTLPSADASEAASSSVAEPPAAATVEEARPSPESGPHIRMTKLALSGENSVHFRDESVTPVYQRVLFIEDFALNTIDNRNEALSPFHLVGKSNDYAKINLKGGVAPFTAQTNLTVAGEVNEVSLPSISPYIRDPLGFVFKSGQLDTRIDIKIVQSDIKGDLVLRMRGIDMSSSAVQSNSLAAQSAVPLNVALGMLKDGKGNIKLKVPLKGSVNDPSFGLNSFLVLVTKKAIASQAKSYLMQTFVPYASVVSVAITAGKFALKLRFDDLHYVPEQIDVSDKQQQYLGEFIQLMKDKSDAQVKVCGVATPADASDQKDSELSAEEKSEALRAIAAQRAEAFKEYVVKEGELASSRILLCQPQVDYSKDAAPRVSISL